jgi:hypothetical protein
MFWRASSQSKAKHTVKTHYRDILDFLIGERHLAAVVDALQGSVHDLFSLARVNTATWAALAGDHALWRGVYVDSDPLVTNDIR